MLNILLHFVPETVDWRHSWIPIVVDKFSILAQMSQLQRKPASSLLTSRWELIRLISASRNVIGIAQLIHYSATKLSREILLKTPGTATHIVNAVFTDLELTENKLKQSCIFSIQDMMLTFRTVRQALLFDLKWSICHTIQRLLRKIDYTGNFYKPVVGLIWGTRVHDDCGDFGKIL